MDPMLSVSKINIRHNSQTECNRLGRTFLHPKT